MFFGGCRDKKPSGHLLCHGTGGCSGPNIVISFVLLHIQRFSCKCWFSRKQKALLNVTIWLRSMGQSEIVVAIFVAQIHVQREGAERVVLAICQLATVDHFSLFAIYVTFCIA